jgi:hypothetical protein
MRRFSSLLVVGAGLVICLSLALPPIHSANADPYTPTATPPPTSDIKTRIQQHQTPPLTQPPLKDQVLEECPFALGHKTIPPEPTLLQHELMGSETFY